ncbi:phospholipase-like protein [Tanacetum coccineum]
MSDLYDVKISVMSSVKLLSKIKGLLSMKPDRERLFRDTVFGPCELVFMGKEKRNFLTKHIMWLVDDFDAWNAFPWGEYMWEKIYNRTINVVSRHTEHHLAELKKNPNFNATYNLYGFAWAFKFTGKAFGKGEISYPNSQKWWSKKANVIPCGLAWSKGTMFEKSDYEELFGLMSNPNVALISSPEEMSQAWFKASAEFIKGLDDQDGTFFQDDQVDDGDGVLDSQSDDGDGVLDSQTKDVIEEAAMLPTMSSNSPQARNAAASEFFAEFDALKKEVLLIKRRKDDEFDELTKRYSKVETFKTFAKFKKLLTNDLCTENESSDCNQKKSDGGVSIEEKPNFSSHHNDSSNHIGGVSSEAKASSSFAHPGNNEDVSHLDDNMEIDGQNAKDGYSNSQHHLHLLIKALGTKIENPSIDAVVPPKVDDPMLRTIKPKDDFDEADVDSYDDDYMLLFNDEEQPAKSSLNDLELQQEPDKVDVKDGILEQQPNADKGKTTVIQETVRVTVEEGPSLGRGLGTLKFKKKNCQRALRPNYVLRSAQIRKKKMAMSLKSPFGQQSDTTPVPTKRKTRLKKTDDIVLPFDLEDISGQPRIRSINHIMTHDPFVENLSRPDGCKSDKVTVPEYMSAFITNKDLPEYWLRLSCLNIGKSGWLTDQTTRGRLGDSVEKVYFPVNEPKEHWCLAELEIRTGVVTFYDSLGWAGGSRRRWWRRMKKVLP